MNVYLAYTNTVTSKLAVSLFFVSTAMSRILNNSKEGINIEAVQVFTGCPLPFKPKPLDFVYFIDVPIRKEQVVALDELGVVVTLIGRHTKTYEVFDIGVNDYWSVKPDVSTPLLAYNAFSTQLNKAPSVIKELNREILSGQPGPLLRYYETLFPHGSIPRYLNEKEFNSAECLTAGWLLMRDDENDLETFKKMNWGNIANFTDTLFVKGLAVKPLCLQYPGPNAEKLINGILADGDIDLIISWIITQERVTFSVYSTNKAALAICHDYHPTGTPAQAGFSLPPKAGLALIAKLVAK